MARIRTIKPEFPHSESIGRLSRDARLLFIELWTIVDDSGRHRASSRLLASLLFPYDDDAPSLIDGWMDELERERCLVRYEIEGSLYLEVSNFLKHQKIDHASQSRIPAYSGNPRESSRALAPDLGSSTVVSSTKEQDQNPLPSILDGGGMVPISELAEKVEQTHQATELVLKAAKAKPARTSKPGVDPRYAEFLADLDRYWKQQGHEGVSLPMDAAAGNNLKRWLKEHPRIDEPTWWRWLENMFASDDVNTAWNVRDILSRIHRYADGPLNRYGKPELVCN